MTQKPTYDTSNEHEDNAQYKLKKIAFILLGFVLIILSVLLVKGWKSSQKAPPKRPQEKTLTLVSTLPINLSDNQVLIKTNGFIRAKYTTRLATQVSGKIIYLAPNLNVGERIKKGTLLVKIDDTRYQAALAAAKSAYATANSAYAQELARAKQAKDDSRQMQIKMSNLAQRKPQLAAAKAAIDHANAQITLAKKDIDNSLITAPFNALVKSRSIAPADIASANSVLTELISLDTFSVKVSLNSAVAHLVTAGNTVKLTPNNGTKKPLTINRINPQFDEKNRTISAYIDIDNPMPEDITTQNPFYLNRYISLTIEGKTISNSQWLDNNTIINRESIWLKKMDDTIIKQAIHIIYENDDQSLVTFVKAKSPTEKSRTTSETLLNASIIARPKTSFFVGQKVSTQQKPPININIKPKVTQKKQNKKNPNQKAS